MRRLATTLLATAAVMTGCGGDDAPRPESAASATATATPAPPAAPRARTVRFKANDGARVIARYTSPGGRDVPAVVLLHEIRGGPAQWDGLVPYLHEAGFATLAYQSRSSPIERDRLHDLLGALRWLRARPEVDDRRLGLVGASIGASTTVFAMADATRRSVAGAVALSPPDSADIWALQSDHRYRPHDVLMVSDERESSAVDGMMEGAVRSRAMRSKQSGHGVALLAESGVHDALLAWLDERVRR
jgi:pimeloyl-ACP methyl ester carboxylesterase